MRSNNFDPYVYGQRRQRRPESWARRHWHWLVALGLAFVIGFMIAKALPI